MTIKTGLSYVPHSFDGNALARGVVCSSGRNAIASHDRSGRAKRIAQKPSVPPKAMPTCAAKH